MMKKLIMYIIDVVQAVVKLCHLNEVIVCALAKCLKFFW